MEKITTETVMTTLSIALLITFFVVVMNSYTIYLENKADQVRVDYLRSSEVLEFKYDLENYRVGVNYNIDEHIKKNGLYMYYTIYDGNYKSVVKASQGSFDSGADWVYFPFTREINGSFTKKIIELDIFYNDRYAFTKSFIYYNNASKLLFEGKKAKINNVEYEDYYLGLTNTAYVEYEDKYKSINTVLVWNDSINFKGIDLRATNLTFRPNSWVKINDKSYKIDSTGDLRFVYDGQYPIIRLFFPDSESEFYVNIQDHQSFIEPNKINDVKITCLSGGLPVTCDLVLEYVSTNLITDKFINSKNGIFTLFEGDYSISATNKEYGSATLMTTISASTTINLVLN